MNEMKTDLAREVLLDKLKESRCNKAQEVY